ncbi:MAG: hypothetical protein HYZ49_18680 [Chloroflexi bacterium]|nr:hypothetical protein [Chloroflexota bacterium]
MMLMTLPIINGCAQIIPTPTVTPSIIAPVPSSASTIPIITFEPTQTSASFETATVTTPPTSTASPTRQISETPTAILTDTATVSPTTIPTESNDGLMVLDVSYNRTLAKDATQEHSFSGIANTPLKLTLQGESGLNYWVEILDSKGISRFKTGTYNGPNIYEIPFTPAANDTYTLRLTGTYGFGDYVVSLSLIASPNRTPGAPMATLDLTNSGRGSLALGSFDIYLFQGVANTPLKLTLQGESGLNYWVEILDSKGISKFKTGTYNGPNIYEIPFTPAANDTYTLRLTGTYGFGDYVVSVSK